MNYKDFLKECVRELHSSDVCARRSAAVRLGSSGPRAAEAIPSLIELLRDVDYVSASVAWAISEIGLGSHVADEAFIAALFDSDTALRLRAMSCIRIIDAGSRKALIPIVILLDDDCESVADEAMRLLIPETGHPPYRGSTGQVMREASLVDVPNSLKSLAEYNEHYVLSFVQIMKHSLPDSVSNNLTISLQSDLSGTPSVKRLSLVGMAWAGWTATEELAARVLESDDDTLRRLAAIAMGYHGAATTSLLRTALMDRTASVRREAARSLGYVGPEAASAEFDLVNILNDADPLVRYWAALAVGQIKPHDPKTLGRLLGAARSDSNSRVVIALCSACSDILAVHPSCASEKFIAPLLESMRGMPEEEDISDCSDCLKILVSTLGDIWLDEATLQLLRDCSRDEKAHLRALSARVLRIVKNKKSKNVIILSSLLGDSDSLVRAEAVESLEHLGADAGSALHSLIAAFEDEAPRIRSAAASALGQIEVGAGHALPSLIRLLADPDQLVRLVAAESLTKLNPLDSTALQTLLQCSEAAGPRLRRIAFESLARMGAVASAAIPVLLRHQGDEDERPDVREAAANALAMIDPNWSGQR